MTNKRIYVIPRARTGGTLLTAILNAHSSITMSYEIFPDLLLDNNGIGFTVDSLIKKLLAVSGEDPNVAIRKLPKDSFRVFIARANRSGLSPTEISNVLSKFHGRTFSTLDIRLDFINEVICFQARKERVDIAGAKIKCNPRDLYTKCPKAVFAAMVRDGRDVFVSRKFKGNFNMTLETCARDWVESLQDFQKFQLECSATAFLVKYESLVDDVESELSPILNSLEANFEPTMRSFEKSKQPLFENPHGHLSANDLKLGIMSNSIGKWEQILSEDEVREFEDIAGETLVSFGYDLKF